MNQISKNYLRSIFSKDKYSDDSTDDDNYKYEQIFNVYNEKVCLICFKNFPEICQRPCMHKLYCKKCFDKNPPKKCDVCKKDIIMYMIENK
jgi:hypothetical protein